MDSSELALDALKIFKGFSGQSSAECHRSGFLFMFLLPVLLFLSLPCIGSGIPGPCFVQIYICDEEMKPLADVNVRCGVVQSVTNTSGETEFSGLSEGFYEFEISRQGFRTDSSQVSFRAGNNRVETMLFSEGGVQAPEVVGLEAEKIRRTLSENHMMAAPTASGVSGLIDIPDANTVEEGTSIFGAHFMRADGVTANADIFAYKILYGVGDGFELSASFIDTKLGDNGLLGSSGDPVVAVKYRVSESFSGVDLAIVGQAGRNRTNIFGVFDFPITDGKITLALKNTDGGWNSAVNIGTELKLPDVDRFIGRGQSTFIFELEQADNRFNLFNAGLRFRSGSRQTLDVFVLQDRRLKDDNGNRSRNQRTFGIGGSLEF